mgnify:CR=1 FL=1
MAEEIFKGTYDDSEILAKLERLEKQVVGIGKAVDTVGNTASDSLNAGADAAENFNKALEKSADATAKQATAVQQARTANQSWLQSIRQTIAGQQIGGKSLGEWADQARSFASRISEGAKAVQGATIAQRVFNGVLKASGIGLLIGLVASAIAYFSKFQSGIDKVSAVMAGLNAVITEVVDRFVKLGSSILKVFTGDFAGAAADVTAAVTGIGDALINAATAAFNLERRLQALRDATITASVETARQRVELEKLKAISDNETLSISKRARTAQQAAEIERKIAEDAVDRALEAQQIAQGKFLLDKESLAAREEAARAEVALQEAVQNLNSVTFEAEKQQRAFRKEAADEREKQLEKERKALEEFRKLLEDVQKQAAALDIENTFNPVERVLKAFDRATEEAKKLQAKLLSLATTPEQKEKVNKAIEALFAEINAKYAEEFSIAVDELEKLRGGQRNFNPLPPPDTLTADIQFRAKAIFAQVKDAVKKESKSALESVLESLADVFRLKGQDVISVEEAKQIFAGLKTAFTDLTAGLSALNEAAISEQERLISALDERIQKQQDVVDKEREIAENGLANNLASEKDRLEKLQKQREEAEKKRLDLQKKAVRQQLLIDSAQQVSSLATGAANVLKAESNKGLLGVLFAIGAIATLFSVFAKAKATAAKSAADVPKFRKGTKLEGPSHENGGLAISDSYGRTVGEAEGGEWLIGSQPSREHDAFLKRLNAGQFKGVDLMAQTRAASYNSPLTGVTSRTRELQQQRERIEHGQHFEALVRAYEKGATRIVEAIEQKPVAMPWRDGYRIETKTGNVKTIEKVRPE